MTAMEVSLEILKIVISEESFDGLDVHQKKEKVIQIFQEIYTKIKDIERDSVVGVDSVKNEENIEDVSKSGDKKDKSTTDKADTGENGDKKDKSTTDKADTGKNGDKKDKNTTDKADPEDPGKNGD